MQAVSVGKALLYLFNWAEVWALLIPLTVLYISREKQPRFLLPVVLYLWVALVLNTAGDVIADFKKYLPAWMQSNNPIYNIHSVIRFACFSAFFILRKPKAGALVKSIIFLFGLFLIVYFGFFESFADVHMLSGDLLAVEAYLLLIFCMQYYLLQLQHEVANFTGDKDFWVVTGLSIFVVINFFIFLFYVPLLYEAPAISVNMWYVHNVAYIVLCTLIAKAFYVSPEH